MSKLNIFLILLLFVMLTYAKIDSASTRDEVSVANGVTLPTATPTPTRIPVALPQVINIPKLGIIAPVTSVGADEYGKMSMPDGWFNTGWYNGGAKPGEAGNAVIAGHYDTNTGAPALFYKLQTLEGGDEVTVTAQDGKQYTFVVTGKATYKYDEVPLDEVFGADSRVRLNLMTCTGWFDYKTHNYSHRVIIFTELKH